MPTELHPGLQVKTRSSYETRKFVDVSMPIQKYLFAAAIQRNASRSMGERSDGTRYVVNFGLPVEVRTSGGSDLKWNVKVARGDNFGWVTGATPLNIDRRDYEKQATAYYRMCRVHYSINEEELADCRGPEMITDLRVTRRLGAEQDFCAGFEDWGWAAPPASTDTETAWPLRYSLYTEPESTVGSYSTFTDLINEGLGNFLNVNHASYTSGPYGISRADYQSWGNWNCQYTNFGDDDYVEKFVAACFNIGFQSPVPFPQLDNQMPNQGVYTTLANIIEKGRRAKLQNDANTSDLAARIPDMDMFQVPYYAVPQFNNPDFTLYGTQTAGVANSKDVVFLIDWSSWAWITKAGFNFEDRRFGPQLAAPLDETYAKYLKGNLVNWNPRRNAVLSK